MICSENLDVLPQRQLKDYLGSSVACALELLSTRYIRIHIVKLIDL